MSTYVILGGTGKVGRRLTRSISDLGLEARPVGRGTVPAFDWREESTWGAALAGTVGAFVVGPGSATDWSETLSRFLAVAETTGLQHVVLLSARGVQFHPTGAVATAERAVRNGPLAWTILRPTHFAQNFTEAMFVPQDGRIVAPVGAGAEPFIDIDDIAAVAAIVLTRRGYDGRVLELSGPRSLTFAEAAGVLSRVSGSPVQFVDESDAEHEERLRRVGIPDGYVEWRMAMLRGIRAGSDGALSDGVQEVLGRPATSFRAWADREAAQADSGTSVLLEAARVRSLRAP